MRRIYISLTAALFDLRMKQVTLDDIDSIVANTNYDTVERGIADINECNSVDWHTPEVQAANEANLRALWDRLIQSRRLFPKKYGILHSHYSGERYFNLPTNVVFKTTVARIRFVYENVWLTGGWVWDSASHRQTLRQKQYVFTALDELERFDHTRLTT